jgi:chromosome segregation ATPase
MEERNLSAELTLLATKADSVEKALVQARAELAREREQRQRVDTQAQELRQQLRHARRRAQSAERELAKLNSSIEAEAHSARVRQRELLAQLDQAQEVNDVLRHEVEQTESERRALEVNLREVLGNLKYAAQKAGQRRTVAQATAEEATLVPQQPPENGW